MQPAQRETGRFQSLTYWNHDTDPVSTDAVRRAVAWLPLAAQVRSYMSLSLAPRQLGACVKASVAQLW